jgi:hypothetical protein
MSGILAVCYGLLADCAFLVSFWEFSSKSAT